MGRLRRSELASPGSNLEMLKKASEAKADEVFLDLEDSVAPKEKVPSRPKIVKALNEYNWSGKVRVVRINSIDTKYAYGDLIEVVEGAGEHIDAIMVPKVNRPADIYMIDKLLTELEENKDITHRIGIEAQIESAQGMANVEAIASSSKRLESLIFGPGDYAASIGARQLTIGTHEFAYPGHVWHFALSRMITAAKAEGLDAIDGPFAVIQDLKGFESSANMARLLGCDGKWAIHPNQIEPCNTIFAPTKMEISQAKKIMEEYDKATNELGRGAIAVEGEMVDAATYKLCENVIAKAKMAKLL